MIKVVEVSKEDWKDLAKKAHQLVFVEDWDSDSERIDYALVTEEDGDLVQYATVKEIDKNNSFIQYGGSFPKYRNTKKSYESFGTILDWMFDKYSSVGFLTENYNFPMLKFAIKKEFVITGMRVVRGHLMLEHIKRKGDL
jgi:hypothetical protein